MNLEKLLNRRGRGGRKEIQMVDVISELSWRVPQYNLPMPCFCELGDKSPIPAYPASSASSAVNCHLG